MFVFYDRVRRNIKRLIFCKLMMAVLLVYSLLSGASDGSVAIHDTLTPVGTCRYTCPAVQKIQGKLVSRSIFTSLLQRSVTFCISLFNGKQMVARELIQYFRFSHTSRKVRCFICMYVIAVICFIPVMCT